MVGMGLLGDTELIKCLRRVNLDVLWSREPSTIKQNLGKVNRALQISHELVMRDPPMPNLGPCMLMDEFGAAAVAIMVKHSMDLEVTETTVQFETVRKMKLAFVNFYRASVRNEISAVIGGKYGKKQLIIWVTIYHVWYDRAQFGTHHRMGYKVLQEYGLSNRWWWLLKWGWKRSGKAHGTTRKKTARDCAVGLLRIGGLCPGVARTRNYKNQIERSEKLFWGWSDGDSSCHADPDWEL
jgi:hypothetical protein